MNPLVQAWLEFAVCGAMIAIAGTRLSRYGDVIAHKTGLGGTWVGLVMMATVTSLPELITGASAVTLANVPDIAIGDVLGSCVFNLLLVVLLDFLHRGESVYTRASHGHILSAGFGVIMIGVIGSNVLLGERGISLSIFHVGAYAPVLVVFYVIGMRMMFIYEEQQRAAEVEERAERYPDITLRVAAMRYAMSAAVVVVAGVWLPFAGERIAVLTGWNQTFVGTLFVAAATSLPELVVTIAAVRMGAINMAIGDLFGSNLFNCVIVVIDDLLYLDGPILSAVAPLHAVSAVSAMMMSGVAVVALLYRPATRLFHTVGWASLLLLMLYLLNTFVLFLYGK